LVLVETDELIRCGKQEILTRNQFPAIIQEKKNRYYMIAGMV